MAQQPYHLPARNDRKTIIHWYQYSVELLKPFSRDLRITNSHLTSATCSDAFANTCTTQYYQVSSVHKHNSTESEKPNLDKMEMLLEGD